MEGLGPCQQALSPGLGTAHHGQRLADRPKRRPCCLASAAKGGVVGHHRRATGQHMQAPRRRPRARCGPAPRVPPLRPQHQHHGGLQLGHGVGQAGRDVGAGFRAGRRPLQRRQEHAQVPVRLRQPTSMLSKQAARFATRGSAGVTSSATIGQPGPIPEGASAPGRRSG